MEKRREKVVATPLLLNWVLIMVDCAKDCIRILHVSSGANLDGGAERCLKEMICLELENGFQVSVVLPAEGTLSNWLREHGVSTYVIPFFATTEFVHCVGMKLWLKSARFKCVQRFADMKISRLIRAISPSIIHINSLTCCLGARSAISERIPLIWHAREFVNTEDAVFKFIDANEMRRLLSRSNVVICVSQCLERSIRKLTDNKMPTTVLYDSVSLPSEKMTVTEPREKDDICKICCIGNIGKAKGQLQLVLALAALRKRANFGFQLALIGRVAEKEYLREIHAAAQSSGIEDCIRYMGVVGDVYPYLSESDVLVNCSLSESFGRVTIEGLLQGCVVIGNDNTATHELLKDNRGMLYDGTTEDLSEKIRLFSNLQSDEIHEIVENGRRFALSLTSQDQFQSAYCSIIEQNVKAEMSTQNQS